MKHFAHPNPINTHMSYFEEYINHGDPEKKERANLWRIAIGLQQVDGLKVSAHLIEIARQHIEGDITIAEVKGRIDAYYKRSASRETTKEDNTGG